MDALARSIVTSGARVDKEVTINGRDRPADLMIHGWGPKDEALDATVSHTVATFDSPGAQNRLGRVASSEHGHYDVSCRQANLGFRFFGRSSFGSAAPEAMEVIGDLRSHLCERFGKRQGRVLAQQAVEKIAVACMKGVAAELSQACIEATAPEALTASAPSPPGVDGGLEDKGYLQWKAQLHGFEPGPPTGIPGSTGIRFVTHGCPAAASYSSVSPAVPPPSTWGRTGACVGKRGPGRTGLDMEMRNPRLTPDQKTRRGRISSNPGMSEQGNVFVYRSCSFPSFWVKFISCGSLL